MSKQKNKHIKKNAQEKMSRHVVPVSDDYANNSEAQE